MTLYFGLGQASSVDRLEVRWPAGSIQEWKDVRSNQKLLITEDSPKVQPR
jgi:hypothetical protein